MGRKGLWRVLKIYNRDFLINVLHSSKELVENGYNISIFDALYLPVMNTYVNLYRDTVRVYIY